MKIQLLALISAVTFWALPQTSFAQTMDEIVVYGTYTGCSPAAIYCYQDMATINLILQAYSSNSTYAGSDGYYGMAVGGSVSTSSLIGNLLPSNFWNLSEATQLELLQKLKDAGKLTSLNRSALETILKGIAQRTTSQSTLSTLMRIGGYATVEAMAVTLGLSLSALAGYAAGTYIYNNSTALQYGALDPLMYCVDNPYACISGAVDYWF